jgi:hypothetical protein
MCGQSSHRVSALRAAPPSLYVAAPTITFATRNIYSLLPGSGMKRLALDARVGIGGITVTGDVGAG